MMEDGIIMEDIYLALMEYDNDKLGETVPSDPYGYSKYHIENAIRNYDNIINLRIFNCFGIYEDIDRMIKSNILKYILIHYNVSFHLV